MNDKIRQASVDITSLGFQLQNLTSTLIESTEIELFEFFFHRFNEQSVFHKRISQTPRRSDCSEVRPLKKNYCYYYYYHIIIAIGYC